MSEEYEGDLFGDDEIVQEKVEEKVEEVDDVVEEEEEKITKDYVLNVRNTDKLSEHLEKYYNNKEYSDVSFELDEGKKTLPCHKFILSARSSKFEELFKDGKSRYEVPSKFSSSTFMEATKFLYTGKVTVDKTNAEKLLLCADAYGMNSLKGICFDFTLKSLDKESVIKTIMKAKRKEFEYDASILVEKCFKFSEDFASDIVESKSFLEFDEETLIQFCKNGKLAVGEADLLNAVVRWGKDQLKTKKDEKLEDVLKNILPHIRLPQISDDDIKNIVEPLKLFTKDEIQEALDYNKDPDSFKKKEDVKFKTRAAVFIGSTLISTKDALLLDKWIKSKNKKPWKLIYKATKDGFSSSQFHKLCDNKGETVSVIKATNGNIFGGYTPRSWNQTGSYEYDANGFLFSLVNAQKKQYKFDQNTIYGQYTQLGSSSYGPTFGGGHDFMICNNSNTTNSSYSNFGYSYTITSTGYVYGNSQAQSFLAGSYNFKTLEIEVFAKGK